MLREVVGIFLDQARQNDGLLRLLLLQSAADMVACDRPDHYGPDVYNWWHLYYDTKDEIVTILQSKGGE